MPVPVLGLVVGLLGKLLLAIAAFRLFFITLIVVVLPTVLNNFVYGLIENSIDLINANLPAGSDSLVFQLSGIGAYLGSQLGIIDCFNIVMAFITAKLALSMIPFSPIK